MKWFSLLLIFFFSQLLPAEAGTISGTVQNETGEYLHGANIMLKEIKMGTISGKNGEFTLSNVPAGEDTLQVSFIGYKSLQIAIVISADDSYKMDVQLESTTLAGQEIVVSATRAKDRDTPVVFTNISRDEISEKHSVEDIPMMLMEIPNVYAYSEAGNGVGYTYLKVRGFDQKRIGVMINGIPLNDPEDHNVYWVDMPDFAESVEDIQFQRGVGTSLYGVSTFGGSLNLKTQNSDLDQSAFYINYGSEETRKFGFKKTASFFDDAFRLNARFSRVESDGYRDNSAMEMMAFFSSLSYQTEKSKTELNIYGGNEKTHAAWYASAESDLKEDHHNNPIEYDNEIDDFSQPHFELHHTYHFSDQIKMKNSLFYIRGKGYYEQSKSGRDLWEYGLWTTPDEMWSDLIRQKWVEKNHYGWVSQLAYQHKSGELTLGSYISLFDSDHWGEVKSLLGSSEIENFKPGTKYYQYGGDKSYLTFYANELFRPLERLSLMVNFYFQRINYQFEQKEVGNFKGAFRHTYEVEYNFFNPRFGINYNISKNINMFGNVSIAQREPTDDELFDIWDGPDDLGVQPLFKKATEIRKGDQIEKIEWSDPIVEEEKLIDFEFGAAYLNQNFNIKANFFWMDFENEIVAYGTVDDNDNPIRGNADETVHRGIELSLISKLPSNFEFSGSFSYNDNYFKKFEEHSWGGITTDYSGNKIAGFPDVLSNGRLTYRLNPIVASVQMHRFGKQYLDNEEDEARTIPAVTVFNASLILPECSIAGGAEINFRVNNIFDKSYYTAGYYDAWEEENFYWPAAGTTWIGGIRFKL